MSEANRVRWHSRRGMLELDVLLAPFAEQAYDHLSAEDQASYRQLLECEDPDLFQWLMEYEVPAEENLARIVRLVLEHGHSQSRL